MTRALLQISLTSLTMICAATRSGMVFSDDFSVPDAQWQGDAANPLFTGRRGRWDELIRERGWIMKDGDTWKLWYTGYNRQRKPLTMKMGYATSEDGISWKRWSDDPVFDEVWIEDMMIVRHNGRWFMFAEGKHDQPQLLESDDGIHWERTGILDVRRENGESIKPGPYGTPTVLIKDNVWHLFYERRDTGIWLARSTDRKVWTNVSDDPVIVPGPAAYDALMIAMNQIVKIGDRYYAVLHGTGTSQKPRRWCTYFAESENLVQWTKLARGPVLPVEANKSSGLVLHDGEGWRLYTMHAQVEVWFPAN